MLPLAHDAYGHFSLLWQTFDQACLDSDCTALQIVGPSTYKQAHSRPILTPLTESGCIGLNQGLHACAVLQMGGHPRRADIQPLWRS